MIDLRLGDALEVLKTLEAGSVDAVVTDPPYGMKWNADSTRFSGGKSPSCGRKIGNPMRVDGIAGRPMIAGDSKTFDPSPWLAFPKVILWGSNHYSSRLPVGSTLVWLKRSNDGFGSFLSDAEIGWQKGGCGVYCHRRVFGGQARRKEAGSGLLHPNLKPLSLMRWCIERLKFKPGATILDPYMGSGTTGVAAVQLGFNFIGVEIDPDYFAIAERRINAELAGHNGHLGRNPSHSPDGPGPSVELVRGVPGGPGCTGESLP